MVASVTKSSTKNSLVIKNNIDQLFSVFFIAYNSDLECQYFLKVRVK